MYKITGIDVKNNKYKVLDTISSAENICTREQLLQSRDMGFKVFGVLPDDQVVVWDTFYKLSLLSNNSKKKLIEILKDYNTIIVTDDTIINEGLTGNHVALNISNRLSMHEMFRYCNAMSLDLCDFDTSKVTDMDSMFLDCDIKNLDLSGFDTSNVVNMSGMFFECKAASLDLRNFDTSNVTSMESMFYRCKATSIDLRNFDTSKVTDTKNMFYEYLGNEIILRKDQERLINRAKIDGQEDKIVYV